MSDQNQASKIRFLLNASGIDCAMEDGALAILLQSTAAWISFIDRSAQKYSTSNEKEKS